MAERDGPGGDPFAASRRRQAARAGSWLVAVVAVVAFGATAVGAGAVPAPAGRPGDVAPPFEVQRFTGTIQVIPGRTVALAQLQGRPLVLNFWSSWCRVCRDEGALLEQLWREYRERGVVFVGIAAHDTEHNGQAFVRRTPITYPSGFDSLNANSTRYQIAGVPETVFITPDGHVLHRHAGPLTEALARAYLDELVRVSAGMAPIRR